MTFKEFPIYRSHLDLVRSYFAKYLKVGSKVIDATCGNGKDSLQIANIILSKGSGQLFCLDIQSEAIEATRQLLKKSLNTHQFDRITLHQTSFETFPKGSKDCDMIVYNLGYLPGGNKSITTEKETTIASLKKALKWIRCGGVVSLTCYIGHEKGAIEKEALFKYLKTLDAKDFTICSHTFINKNKAPILVLIQKALS